MWSLWSLSASESGTASGAYFCLPMNEDLPRFVKDLLSNAPAHGGGVHRWMFTTSRYLHALRSHDEIVELLKSSLHGCGRRVPDRELQAAISDSKKDAWVPGKKGQDIIYQSAWPKFNKEKYVEVTCDAKALCAADLWESSPVRYMDDKSYTWEIIDRLFPGNPYLCCGLSKEVFEAKRKHEWRKECGKQQFIVPSACKGEMGFTKDGNPSAHCNDNTGPRMYLVIEQDQGNPDQQTAVIVYLTKYLPLRMVLSSGGKSLHAWFDCQGILDESKQKDMMRAAVALGADDSTWTLCQFVRMPDGLRDNGKRQSVFYFNPKCNE